MYDLNNIASVTVNDFSGYESGKSNNGGQYGFWETYTRLQGGETWERIYGCTAQGDIDFCPLCGQFADHSGDEDEDVQTVTTEELGKLLGCITQDEDHWVVLK